MYFEYEIEKLPLQISPQENSYKLFLLRIKFSESNLCCFCQTAQDTLLHLFWECPITEAFWNSVQQFFVSVDLVRPASQVLTLCQCLGLKGEKSACCLRKVYYLVGFTFILASTKMFHHHQ